MLVALVSAKGAPGVTTTALCLTAASSPDALMVEADPSGGDLECWSGPHGEPGLVGLATSLRPGLTSGEVGRTHAVEVAPGVQGVTAPTYGAPAGAALARAADQLGPALAGLGVDAFADLGRWSPTQSTARRVDGADLVLVVCRPTLDSIEHARGVAAARPAVEAPMALVLVGGEEPYGPREVARALGVSVLGVLPWEPRAVLGLISGGVGNRHWQRSRLAAASSDVAEAATRMTEGARASA